MGQRSCKFRKHQLVRHVRTGTVYKILHLPMNTRLEAMNEPAYAYYDVAKNGPIWVRAQVEMEDGRFVPYQGDNVDGI